MAASAPGDHELMRDWYEPSTSTQSSIIDDAFNKARMRFSFSLGQDEKKINLLNSKQSLQEVHNVVLESIAKYEAHKNGPKVIKWLRSFSQRVVFYADVLDVLVQHHPEFVALAWGAMKLLFTGVVNNERTVSKLAKAMSRIADALPRVKLASILYPTERMRVAVTELNVYIMQFLIRAHDWYTEGPLEHAWNSFTQPSELRFDDIIGLVSERSRMIDQLASSCQQAELRDVHGKIDEVNGKVDKIETKIDARFGLFSTKLETIYTTLTTHTSAHMSTNYKLTDLQFANIMAAISDSTIEDPMKVFQQLLAAKQRALRATTGSATSLSRRFWNSPKLHNWNTSPVSNVAIIKGQFRSRQALRHFCVDMIEHFADSGTPVIHALKVPQECLSSSNVSCIDLIKYVVRQALQLGQRDQTEKSMSLRCASFHSNYSEAEWFQVLEGVLSEFEKPAYLILDLELVNRDLIPTGGFPWLSAFTDFFNRLSQRQLSTCLKVLLVAYSSELPFTLSQNDYSSFAIPAKVDSARARQRKPGTNGVTKLRKTFGPRR